MNDQKSIASGAETTDQPHDGNRKVQPLVLHLVLTHHWYDEIIAGRKWIEYRAMSDHWKRLIWDRADKITHVRFQRGFKKNPPKMTFEVGMISVGLCPYEGWDDVYYKVAFGNMQND